MMLTSVQKRLWLEQSVLDTGTRAQTAGIDHPAIMQPPVAGAAEGIKSSFDTSENPQGSPHPQTIQTGKAIRDLEKAVRMIDIASGQLQNLNDGALASTAESIRDLHKLMIEYVSDLKDQASKYISRNRPNELEQARSIFRRNP